MNSDPKHARETEVNKAEATCELPAPQDETPTSSHMNGDLLDVQASANHGFQAMVSKLPAEQGFLNDKHNEV